MFHTKLTKALFAGIFLVLSPSVVSADDEFPTRPIRLIVPYAAGGGTDVLARKASEYAAEQLGQAVVVENRPGASTIIAADAVSRAAPDGYTVLWGDNSTYSVNMFRSQKPAYDSLSSFEPITLTVRGSLVLVVPTSSGVTSVQELVERAKDEEHVLNYGTPGIGSPHHLAMERFKLSGGGLPIMHIPYKGEAPGVQDLLGDNLQLMFTGARAALPHLQSGRLTALGVSGKDRNLALPNVPTLAESGLTGFSAEYWHGLVAPANTPKNVIAKLNKAFTTALQNPELVDWVTKNGGGAAYVSSTPEEMHEHMKADIAAMDELVRSAEIELE